MLNLETTVAVTQNFVNSKNFEFVCLDLAPGYRHKGVSRAGLLALDEGCLADMKMDASCMEDDLSYSDLTRKEKRVRICETPNDPNCGNATNGASESRMMSTIEFSYDISFLSMFLDKERDHYNSLWSSGNCIGQREMREWLWKLWVKKPGLRDLIWKVLLFLLDFLISFLLGNLESLGSRRDMLSINNFIWYNQHQHYN